MTQSKAISRTDRQDGSANSKITPDSSSKTVVNGSISNSDSLKRCHHDCRDHSRSRSQDSVGGGESRLSKLIGASIQARVAFG